MIFSTPVFFFGIDTSGSSDLRAFMNVDSYLRRRSIMEFDSVAVVGILYDVVTA
jgi:hypothetical protein